MKILLFASLLCVLLLSTLEANATVVRNHYLGSSLMASDSGDSVNYFHQDRLGSNRLKTNAEGSRVSEFKSLPFGQTVINHGIVHSFTGKELDIASQLYYFSARYYDNNLGRFTTIDPVKENHAYTYVDNNPMNYVDPTGMAQRNVVFGSDFQGWEDISLSMDGFNPDAPTVIIHGSGRKFREYTITTKNGKYLVSLDGLNFAKLLRETLPPGTNEFNLVSCYGTPDLVQSVADNSGKRINADVSGKVLRFYRHSSESRGLVIREMGPMINPDYTYVGTPAVAQTFEPRGKMLRMIAGWIPGVEVGYGLAMATGYLLFEQNIGAASEELARLNPYVDAAYTPRDMMNLMNPSGSIIRQRALENQARENLDRIPQQNNPNVNPINDYGNLGVTPQN